MCDLHIDESKGKLSVLILFYFVYLCVHERHNARKDNGEELRKGRRSRHREKISTPSRATDAFIGGGEEQNRKQKKERNREWDPSPVFQDHEVVSTTRMDHTVAYS